MIYKVKITCKAINLERVPGSCLINKESRQIKQINLFKFI